MYYGDEIGMGDNIWLGDRDAVRTPMQWSPDRNAGFSRCDPGRLYLPTVQDPTYGYQGINVESQMGSSNSLLNWVRRMVHVRKKYQAFGLGNFRELDSDNPSVLTYLREHGDERLLCVNNLSKYPQAVELDLSEFAGATPVELTGSVPFPVIGADSYQVTLPGHGFYWFELVAPPESSPTAASSAAPTVPVAQAISDAPVAATSDEADPVGAGGPAAPTPDNSDDREANR